MTDVCYSKGINPSAIPGDELDPDGVELAATTISTKAQDVRDTGAAVVTEWRALANHYEAPEAETLFAVMDDVETKSLSVSESLESVAKALQNFAEDIRPIKESLRTIRSDAVAFRNDIAGNPEWDYDQDLVDDNTALVERVNAQQVLLWEAERRCANAIRALYGAEPWHAMTGEDDEFGYGVDELSTEAEMPWGSEVQRRDHCPKSAGVQVKRFVWDGFLVEGVGGTIGGIIDIGGAIFGIGENADATRDGLASLIGLGSTPIGEAWLGVGKGLIMYDSWAEGDYATAAGGTVFNVLTFFIPAGAAVKGAGTAGKAGKFSKALQTGARIGDFVDPVSLMIKGGRLAAPTVRTLFDDFTTGIKGIEIPDFRPGVDRATLPDADAPTGAPTRNPDAQPPRHQPVEAPEPVHAGTRSATEAPGSTQPGGSGNSPEGLAEPPRSPSQPGSSGAAGSDAPTGSSSSGGSTSGGSSSGGSGGSSSGGGHGGSSGAPAAGGIDDIADGAPTNSGGTTGEAGQPGAGAGDDITDAAPGTGAGDDITDATPGTGAADDITDATPGTGAADDITDATPGTGAADDITDATPGTGAADDITDATPGTGAADDITDATPGTGTADDITDATPGTGTADDITDATPGTGTADDITDATPGTGTADDITDATPGTGAADDITDATPGTGAADDITDAAPGDKGDAGGTGTGSEGPSGAAGEGPEQGRVAIDKTGQPHVVNMRDDLISDQARYQDALAEILPAHGLTEVQLTDLVQKPLVDMTRQEVITLIEIREALPPIHPDDVLQKVLPPENVAQILGDDIGRHAEPSLVERAGTPEGDFETIGGFVARGADMLGATPSELYYRLGLNYDTVTFRADGESMFAVRYRAGDGLLLDGDDLAGAQFNPWVPDGPLKAMREMPDSIYDIADPAARGAAMQEFINSHYPAGKYYTGNAFDPTNPFRGSGFGGTGPHYAPEATYGAPDVRVLVPEGAELMRIRPDGTQEIAAVFRDDHWHVIVEQPGPTP